MPELVTYSNNIHFLMYISSRLILLIAYLLGESSLEKLRKTCQLAPVAANIPSLVEVLPYLEVTSHQDYLVRCLNRKCITLELKMMNRKF